MILFSVDCLLNINIACTDLPRASGTAGGSGGSSRCNNEVREVGLSLCYLKEWCWWQWWRRVWWHQRNLGRRCHQLCHAAGYRDHCSKMKCRWQLPHIKVSVKRWQAACHYLYNLLSGVILETIKMEITHAGMCLTILHALCPTFHDIEMLQSTIKDNAILKSDRDNDIRFRSMHEVSHLMKGDSTFVHGEKTINLPIQCQDVPFQKCYINTAFGEQMLFLELCSTKCTVKDNDVSFTNCIIDAKKCRKHKYHTQLWCMHHRCLVVQLWPSFPSYITIIIRVFSIHCIISLSEMSSHQLPEQDHNDPT